jgi:hypothetical protein
MGSMVIRIVADGLLALGREVEKSGGDEIGGIGIELEGEGVAGGLVGGTLEEGSGTGKEVGEVVAVVGQAGGEGGGPFDARALIRGR